VSCSGQELLLLVYSFQHTHSSHNEWFGVTEAYPNYCCLALNFLWKEKKKFLGYSKKNFGTFLVLKVLRLFLIMRSGGTGLLQCETA